MVQAVCSVEGVCFPWFPPNMGGAKDYHDLGCCFSWLRGCALPPPPPFFRNAPPSSVSPHENWLAQLFSTRVTGQLDSPPLPQKTTHTHTSSLGDIPNSTTPVWVLQMEQVLLRERVDATYVMTGIVHFRSARRPRDGHMAAP